MYTNMELVYAWLGSRDVTLMLTWGLIMSIVVVATIVGMLKLLQLIWPTTFSFVSVLDLERSRDVWWDYVWPKQNVFRRVLPEATWAVLLSGAFAVLTSVYQLGALGRAGRWLLERGAACSGKMGFTGVQHGLLSVCPSRV
jgi:hypothetical protein